MDWVTVNADVLCIFSVLMCNPPSPVGFIRLSDFLPDCLHQIGLGVNVCEYGAIQCTGVPNRVYSCLTPTVPGI